MNAPAKPSDLKRDMKPHASHWGVFRAGWQGETMVVEPHPNDPDPSSILGNFPTAAKHKARIAQPMVRRGWLEKGPGPDSRRGRDEYVPVSWEKALDLVAAELARVKEQHGLESIFGGSYGWSSAGRFHHAQSQVHRFLNVTLGGYVRSVNSYSAGASAVIIPHILGPFEPVARYSVTWEQIERETDLILAFGGMAVKNSAVASGGISRHIERGSMKAAAERGCRFLLIGPLLDDLPEEAKAEWLPITPGTDVALMLGIAHTLVAEGLHDPAFLRDYCVGYERFEPYLLGSTDGQAKDADWAAAICGIPAATIREIARATKGKRVLITMAHSLQRAEHGEQPVWMGAVLAAMLGQIGLPGGGFAYALGSLGHYGKRQVATPVAGLNQGRNSVREFIPVARISDMLLKPGEAYDYNGQKKTYPHIRLVYWAGGNPFHHHQDLHRLRDAFATVDTFIVHESVWTGTAKHADIVLPATLTIEREDIAGTQSDTLLVAMHKLTEPFGEARDDYEIFADLAERLGKRQEFTEGRSTREWLAFLYEKSRAALEARGEPAPSFEEFWEKGEILLPEQPDTGGVLGAFRRDPEGSPLETPSGKVEIFSETIDGFGYDDCLGHPAWLPKRYVPSAEAPLWLVANQPATRLHSQLDFGGTSAGSKHRGREVMRIHPQDAARRGIAEGDIVRLFNERGACLAAAAISEKVMPGVVQLPTGAWFDPIDPTEDKPLCVHGNPNVLTIDVGTSKLAQGCTGQLASVEVEKFVCNLPPIRAWDPPGA
ncbi:molybdopterin guanine dinucleotide-containing S/N-oxide reductase [Acetobacteraceae bacterium H6797]|nr:molybdopterin guanine dinucleotide-containing S/N-oxide reductase [Acetobacteraceae bacterium H6797]